MKVYLLVWSHKHGHDYNCFSSEKLAYEHGIEIMRNNLYEWGEAGGLCLESGEVLWDSWPEISGGSEFFEIVPLSVDPSTV